MFDDTQGILTSTCWSRSVRCRCRLLAAGLGQPDSGAPPGQSGRGATILSLYLQEKHGFRAGKAQMAIDSVVVLLALLVVPPQRVAYSILAAVLVGLFFWLTTNRGVTR